MLDDGHGQLPNIPCKCQWEPEATSSRPFGVPCDDVEYFSVQNPVRRVNSVKEERDTLQLK